MTLTQEGVSSEAGHPLLARFYFMAFYIVTLVIIQVFVAYIVDEFKFKLTECTGDCPKHHASLEYCLCARELIYRSLPGKHSGSHFYLLSGNRPLPRKRPGTICDGSYGKRPGGVKLCSYKRSSKSFLTCRISRTQSMGPKTASSGKTFKTTMWLSSMKVKTLGPFSILRKPRMRR